LYADALRFGDSVAPELSGEEPQSLPGPDRRRDISDPLELRREDDVADKLGAEGRKVLDDPAESCVEPGLVDGGEAGDQGTVRDEARLRDVELRRGLDRTAVLGERVVRDVVAAARGVDPGEARGDAERRTREPRRRIGRRHRRHGWGRRGSCANA